MLNKKIVIGLREFFISIILLFLYFQNWLITEYSFFGILDEGIALCCLLIFIYSIISSGKINRHDLVLFCLVVFIIIGGLFFNLQYKIQTNFIPIFEDIFSLFKFIFIFLGTKVYFSARKIDTKRIIDILSPILKIYTLILLILSIVNVFFDIGMDAGLRYGLRMFSFIYETPGHLINQMSYNILFFNAIGGSIKNKRFWIGSSLFVMALTFKTRAFLLISIYFACVYVFKLKKNKNLLIDGLFVVILVFLIGYSQFEHYFLNEGTPRQMFVSGAIRIVKEYFPFGTGFATYGSSAAGEYYSLLYYELGFSNRWGMDPSTKLFLNDNYLPMIFGQFGIIIGTSYLYLIYKYIVNVINSARYKMNKSVMVCTCFYLLDIVLSSIQSSYLAHYSVVTFTIYYLIFFYDMEEKV